jgi:hypothetical protein
MVIQLQCKAELILTVNKEVIVRQRNALLFRFDENMQNNLI